MLRRERALEVTGNQGVEPAMEWCVLFYYCKWFLTHHVGSCYERILWFFKGY